MIQVPWKALVTCGVAMAPLLVAPAAQAALSAVWANEGGDKVMRHELRAASGPQRNSVWDGARVNVWGARNEVVNFALVLESAEGARDVNVTLDRLVSSTGEAISSPASPVRGDAVFDYVGRNIEVFVVDYLQIRGLSRMSYENYDERHVPSKMRLPNLDPVWGTGQGGWADRPGADKYFPDIAVPHELRPAFDIPAGQNQTIWFDVYVPKSASSGTYTGEIIVHEGGAETRRVPVALTVHPFALPDRPTAKTMVALQPYDIAERYSGKRWVDPGNPEYAITRAVMRRHWQMLHRHKLTPVEDPTIGKLPVEPETVLRLEGGIYTAENGYDGPGVGLGDDVYPVGFYGNWPWKDGDQNEWNARTDAWENWFRANAPHVERFLYLSDEPNVADPAEVARINGWLDKLKANPGPGGQLPAFVTTSTLNAVRYFPKLDIAGNWFAVADPKVWDAARTTFRSGGPGRAEIQYNGKRPASGSFAIEDDGVSPRMLPWAQWKTGIGRWFYWQATFYYDMLVKGVQQNVWTTANTFGADERFDAIRGRTGYNYANGEGVLIYPGTDLRFPEVSLGAKGPIASLRLKYWRRGVQDVDYVALANAIDPVATKAVVQRVVPRVLSETGVQDPTDPNWLLADVSWPVDPDAWERARVELAAIIERGGATAPAATAPAATAPTSTAPATAPVATAETAPTAPTSPHDGGP